MKAVIISDIHGNYDALRSLPESYDELWVLGDLVNYGPEPYPVVDYVRNRAKFVVRGNHDHAVGFGTDPRCTPRYAAMAAATQEFTESELCVAQKRFLHDLPCTTHFMRGNQWIYLCHAIPSNPLYGYCPPESEQWPKEVRDLTEADVILVGHTHIPFTRQIGDKLVVNPGSLGQPKTGTPEARYAVWEDGRIELKRYEYPVEETIRELEALHLDKEVQGELISALTTGAVADRLAS